MEKKIEIIITGDGFTVTLNDVSKIECLGIIDLYRQQLINQYSEKRKTTEINTHITNNPIQTITN